MACVVCGKPVKAVVGRGRQPVYCSPRCRRRQEKARALWDRRAALVSDLGYYCQNRDMEFRTEEQRSYWTAELAQAKKDLGPRP